MAVTVWPVDAVAGEPAYSGREARQAMSPALAGATPTRPLGARSGVRPGTSTTTATATSTLWTVKPHAGILDLQSSASAGPYWYAVDADVTGAVTAASGSIIRKDILYVELSDPAESDGSSVPGVAVKYLAGSVANTAPATPARSMRLATITVPISGGGSPTVAWDAPYTVAAGGIIPVRSKAERDALTASATVEGPVYVDRLDAPGLIERSTGTTWTHVAGGGRFVRAAREDAAAISNNTITGLSWTNTMSGGFTNTGNETFTVPEAGRYLVTFRIGFSPNGSGARNAWVLHNGNRAIEDDDAGTAASSTTLGGSRVITCAAGDTFKVEVYQNSGGGLTLTGGKFMYLTIDAI